MRTTSRHAYVGVAALVATLLMLQSISVQTAAATGPMVVLDFEKYAVGTKIDQGIGKVSSGDQDVIPQTVEVVPVYKADVSDPGSGGKKSLKIIAGDSTDYTDTWMKIYLEVPAGKRDWSAYKDGVIGSYFDVREGVLFAYQVFLVDKDDEIWGEKTNFTAGWAFPKLSKGTFKIFWDGSTWGGMGFTDWCHTYSVLKLNDTVFVRIADNADGNGNLVLDYSEIKWILLRVDAGNMGAYKGRTYYVDNFFLAKTPEAFTCDATSGRTSIDGMDLIDFFNAASGGTTAPTATKAPTSATTPVATQTPAPSPAVTEEPTGEATPAPTDGPTIEPTSDATPTPGATNTPGTTGAPPDEDGFGTLAAVGVAAGLIVIAGIVVLVLRNKKKGTS